MRSESNLFFKQSIARIVECRKRYLVRLQKVKYDQLQDRVFKAISENHDTIVPILIEFLPRIKSVAYMSVLNKKATARKRAHDFR